MIEQAMFGRTGHASTRVVFGGAALSRVSQDAADQVLETLRAHGVNHLDTAAAYGDSELRIAPWLVGHRDDYFLATKTGERSGPGARASLERSLTRLGVDHVDLIQLHNLVEEDEWQEAHGTGGAVEALQRAREEGLTRWIGVTGHGTRIPRMHLRSLDRFDFDSVLFPYNHALMANPDYRGDVEALIARCEERDVARLTIKSVARRRWPEDAPPRRYSWYEPLRDTAAVTRAVHYVIGRPGLFLASSSDFGLLATILDAASNPGPVPSDAAMAADAEAQGISPLFDGQELERI